MWLWLPYKTVRVCVWGGYLVDDVNAVSELLALQEGVQVVE